MDSQVNCRVGCGACCIAPSISSPIPGMPDGKRAGERCIHLTEAFLCGLFGRVERPLVCEQFNADSEVCGQTRQQAFTQLAWLENISLPEN